MRSHSYSRDVCATYLWQQAVKLKMQLWIRTAMGLFHPLGSWAGIFLLLFISFLSVIPGSHFNTANIIRVQLHSVTLFHDTCNYHPPIARRFVNLVNKLLIIRLLSELLSHILIATALFAHISKGLLCNCHLHHATLVILWLSSVCFQTYDICLRSSSMLGQFKKVNQYSR